MDAPLLHRGAGPLRVDPTEPKWSWACRDLDPATLRVDWTGTPGDPKVGDLAVARIAGKGRHSFLVTRENRRLQLYSGDLIVGVFGNRYATDAFEAEVRGVEPISMLTAGGLLGTVLSGHDRRGLATPLEFVGYVEDPAGRRANLKEMLFRPNGAHGSHTPLIAVVGTAMNAGKTTVASELIWGLREHGLRVAACKLTGSVSNRDRDSLASASPTMVRDFSDYGFPSTYLADPEELRKLFHTMLADLERSSPDVIVMEVADGILERETALLLRDDAFGGRLTGVLLAASGSLGALYAVDELRSLGHHVLAVSGVVTSSPLESREFMQRCPEVPIVVSGSKGRAIAETVDAWLSDHLPPHPADPADPEPGRRGGRGTKFS